MPEKIHPGMCGDALIAEDGGRIILRSGAQITEDAGAAILGRETLSTYMADAGTAGSAFVVCPFAGTIIGLAAVNHAVNAGTKSVLTAKINGVSVTHPAWEVAVTAAAGSKTLAVPTAANQVLANDVLEVATDGGSTVVTPITATFTIQRAS